MNRILGILIFGLLSVTAVAQNSSSQYTYEKKTSTKVQGFVISGPEKIEEAEDTVHFGFKGNLLSYATLNPHLEFDIFACNHWNFSVGGLYGWWGFNGDHHAFQSWRITGEVRYYCDPYTFTRHSWGLRAESGQSDAYLKKYGRRGHTTTVSITYAYTWSLGKSEQWYMDAGLGYGYSYAHYVKYIPHKDTECYHKVYVRTRHMIGINNVFLNIGYRIPYKNRKGGRHE